MWKRPSTAIGVVALCLTLRAYAQDAGDQASRPDKPGATEDANKEQNSTEQARALFEIGAQAYARGDYASAIAAFREAHTRAQRPGLLFSIAQAHRRAFFASGGDTHLARAIEYYRKYIGTGDQARRRQAEKILSRLVPLNVPRAHLAPENDDPADEAKLMITSPTPGAVLRVDRAVVPHLPYVASVAPGTHKVTVSAPGFRTEVRELPIPEGTTFAFEIALEELPGTLSIKGEAGSEAWVDGRLVGVLPTPAVNLVAGPHQISLRKTGYELVTKKVALQRGCRQEVKLPLVHTVRHAVGMGLLIGGGAVLLASAATATATYTNERRADSLAKRLAEGEASPGDLRRYNDALATRDTLRALTIGLGGAGLGAIVIGSVLVLFDSPQVPALVLESPSNKRRPATSTDIIAMPFWNSDHVGIETTVDF